MTLLKGLIECSLLDDNLVYLTLHLDYTSLSQKMPYAYLKFVAKQCKVMYHNTMIKRVSTSLPIELYNRVKQLADREQRSISKQVVFLLLEYFEIIDRINNDN